MKKSLLITITFTLFCFTYYLQKTLILLKTNSGFKITRIGIYDKQELLGRNLNIFFIKGVIKSHSREIIILNPTIFGLKEISKGRILTIVGPFYDTLSKFETVIQIHKKISS